MTPAKEAITVKQAPKFEPIMMPIIEAWAKLEGAVVNASLSKTLVSTMVAGILLSRLQAKQVNRVMEMPAAKTSMFPMLDTSQFAKDSMMPCLSSCSTRKN